MVDLTRLSDEDLDAIVRRDMRSVSDEGLQIIAGGNQYDTSEDEGWFIPEAVKGLASGASGMLSSAATGASFLLPEEAEQSARRGIASLDSRIQEALAPASNYEDSMTRKFTQALGSTAPFLASAFFGIPGVIAGVATGAAAGSGEAANRAIAAGATEEQISQAAGRGMVPGLLETAAPFGMGRVLKYARTARATRAGVALAKGVGEEKATDIISRLRRVALATGGEGLQEASSEIMQNMIAQDVYDPDTGTFTGTGESFGYGAGVGGFIEGLIELTLPRGWGPKGGSASAEPSTSEGDSTPNPAMRDDLTDEEVEKLLEEQAQFEADVEAAAFDEIESATSREEDAFATNQAIVANRENRERRQQEFDLAEQQRLAQNENQVAGSVDELSEGMQNLEQGNFEATENAPTAMELALKPALERAYDAGTATPQREESVNVEPGTAQEGMQVIRGSVQGPVDPNVVNTEVLDVLGIPKGVTVYDYIENNPLDITNPTQRTTVIEKLTGYARRTKNPAVAERIGRYIQAIEPQTYNTGIPQNTRTEQLEIPFAESNIDVANQYAERATAPVDPFAGVDSGVAPLDPTTLDTTPNVEPSPNQTGVVGKEAVADIKDAQKPKNIRAMTEAAQDIRLDAADVGAIVPLGNINWGQRVKGDPPPMQVPDKAAASYFNVAQDPKVGLHMLAGDLVEGAKNKGTRSLDRANNAQLWVRENMSPLANTELDARVEKLAAVGKAPPLTPRQQEIAASREGMTPDELATDIAAEGRLNTEQQREDVRELRQQQKAAETSTETVPLATNEEILNQNQSGTTPFNARNPSTAQTETAQTETLPSEKTKAELEQETALEVYRAKNGQVKVKNEDGSTSSYDALEADAILATTEKLAPEAVESLEQGDLISALLTLTNSTDRLVRKHARELAAALGTDQENLPKAVMVDNLVGRTGKQEAGRYDSATDTISINRSVPLVAHTLLHESNHAATAHIIKNPANPVTKQLKAIFNDIRDVLPSAYGTNSLEDFVAEAHNNKQFKSDLSAYTANGTRLSAWRRFANAISTMLRFGPVFSTADSVTTAYIENILATAPQDRKLTKIWEQIGDGKEGDVVKGLIGAGRGLATKKELRDAIVGTKSLLRTAGQKTRWGVMNALSLQNLVEIAKNTLPSAELMYEAIKTTDGMRTQALQDFNNTAVRMGAAFKGDSKSKEMWDMLVSLTTTNRVNPTYNKFKATNLYGKDTHRFKMWQTASNLYNTLSTNEQRQAYKDLLNAYQLLNKRVLDSMKARIASYMESEELRGSELNKKVLELLQGAEGLIDPYVPLDRQGDFWVEYTWDTDRGGDNIVRSSFQSQRELDVVMARLKDNPSVNNVVQMQKSAVDAMRFDGRVPLPFLNSLLEIVKEIGAIEVTGVDGKPTKTNKLADELRVQIANNMPESQLLQGVKEREDTAGFDTDHLAVFKRRAPALVNAYANIANQPDMDKAKAAIVKEALERPDDNLAQDLKIMFVGTKAETDNTVGNLPSYYEFSKNPYLHEWARNARAATFVWTLGANLSGALVNSINPVLTGIPILGGEYGFRKASNALARSTNLLIGSGAKYRPRLIPDVVEKIGPDGRVERDEAGNPILVEEERFAESLVREGWATTNRLRDVDADITDKRRQENMFLAPFTKEVVRTGADVRSQTQEWTDMDNSNNPYMQKLMTVAGWMQNHSERFSRNSVGISAYMLRMEKILSKPYTEMTQAEIDEHGAEAAKYALNKSEEVNSSAYVVTGARIGQNNWGSLASMYKRFPAQQAYIQGKMLNAFYQTGMGKADKVAEVDPAKADAMREEYRQLRKGMYLLYGTSSVLAGVAGVPFYGVVSEVLDLFRDEDEDDVDSIMAKSLGELGFGGIFNAWLNIDISGRISMSDLLIRDRGNYEPENQMLGVLEMFGGPTYGVATRIGRGWADIVDGNYLRAGEAILPSGLGNMVKTSRFIRDEGATTRRGDFILENMHPWSLAAQGLGFTPADYARARDANALNYRKDRAITEERGKLMDKLYEAWGFADGEGYEDAQIEIAEFNERHPTSAITEGNVVASIQQRVANTLQAAELQGVILQNGKRVEEAIESNKEFEDAALFDFLKFWE